MVVVLVSVGVTISRYWSRYLYITAVVAAPSDVNSKQAVAFVVICTVLVALSVAVTGGTSSLLPDEQPLWSSKMSNLYVRDDWVYTVSKKKPIVFSE